MPEGALLTVEDLDALPYDELVTREIIDGVLYVTAAPRLRHQKVAGRIHTAFFNHIEAYGGGEVYWDAGVLFSQTNAVEPDILFVADDQLDQLGVARVEGAPALVIEVLSDPRHDKVRKRDLYARFGVPEYWVVDPDADRVEVYRLEAGTYAKPQILEPGETLTYDRLPGFRIDLGWLFAR